MLNCQNTERKPIHHEMRVPHAQDQMIIWFQEGRELRMQVATGQLFWRTLWSSVPSAGSVMGFWITPFTLACRHMSRTLALPARATRTSSQHELLSSLILRATSNRFTPAPWASRSRTTSWNDGSPALASRLRQQRPDDTGTTWQPSRSRSFRVTSRLTASLSASRILRPLKLY
jgi:hypothetical protein